MLEALPVWGPLAVGGLLWFLSLRAGEASVFMRSWIPSWRFFENIGPVPLLEYCLEGQGGTNNWETVPNPSGSESARLFFSPYSNAFHAFESLVLDFSLDPGHPDLEHALVEEAIHRIRSVHPGVSGIRLRVRWRNEGESLSFPLWERTWNSPNS
jgi:hypothetical protein